MKIIMQTVGMVRTNCYIAYDENSMQGVIIDPGDDAPGLLKTLDKHQVKLQYILLTHGHFDHILAVPAIKKQTGAQVVIHAQDAACLTEPGRSLSPAGSGQAVPPDVVVYGGESLQAGDLHFNYLHTPGHTRGSCVILCGRVMFSGDTLFKEECGRCDLPGGSFEQMLRSLKMLGELEGDYQVLPGHDASTTLSHERRGNPYMKQACGL